MPNDRIAASNSAHSVPVFRSFQYDLEHLRNDTRLEFQLRDTDGLHNRQPIRYDFTILRDQPPVVTARLDGIGSAVTPHAVLPAAGEITDDYGIAAAQFRYEITKASPAEQEPETQTGNEGTVALDGLGAAQTIFSIAAPFAVSDCTVQPGDKLTLWIEATDRFNLDKKAGQSGEEQTGGGQTGPGPRWTLEIVTPERLRSLLEVREIVLRQRFEVLIGEVELTKELIETVPLDVTKELLEEAEKWTLPTEEETDQSRDNNQSLARQEAVARREELEAKRKALLETIAKEQADAGRYNISRALRDTQKEIYEIRTIVESFRLIRAEMVNNRIFTDDDEIRLDGGIISPLQELVVTDFPELDRLIALLDETLATRDQPLRNVAVQQRQAAVVQLDELLKKMSAIRDGMVSMESFNEVIDILRAIIRQQQQIRQETVEEKNKRLRNLLE